MTGVFENRIISYRSYPYRVRNSVFIVLYILLVMIRSISFFFCEAIKMNWIGISKPTQRTHKSSKRNSNHWYVKYVEQYATRMMSSITIESVKRNQAKKRLIQFALFSIRSIRNKSNWYAISIGNGIIIEDVFLEPLLNSRCYKW